jgi:hypothetical protein
MVIPRRVRRSEATYKTDNIPVKALQPAIPSMRASMNLDQRIDRFGPSSRVKVPSDELCPSSFPKGSLCKEDKQGNESVRVHTYY